MKRVASTDDGNAACPPTMGNMAAREPLTSMGRGRLGSLKVPSPKPRVSPDWARFLNMWKYFLRRSINCIAGKIWSMFGNVMCSDVFGAYLERLGRYARCC